MNTWYYQFPMPLEPAGNRHVKLLDSEGLLRIYNHHLIRHRGYLNPELLLQYHLKHENASKEVFRQSMSIQIVSIQIN